MAPTVTGCEGGRVLGLQPEDRLRNCSGSVPWANYFMQYIQIRVADSLLKISSLALLIPVLFVCLGNTGHRSGT